MMQGQQELAAKLKADTQAITNAIDAWSPGKPAADVVRLINKLIMDLQLLPLNDKIKPFVILALGTAAHIIELINRSSPGGGMPQTNVHITNPPSNEKEYKKEWNCIRDASEDVAGIPAL